MAEIALLVAPTNATNIGATLNTKFVLAKKQ